MNNKIHRLDNGLGDLPEGHFPAIGRVLSANGPLKAQLFFHQQFMEFPRHRDLFHYHTLRYRAF